MCALVGYYCAAYVIDKPSVGRKKLQMISNMVCAIIFLIAGLVFNSAGPSVLMFLYFFSSYTVNFGPNVTTYVMAAETYPTEMRATLHGSESIFFTFFSLTIYSHPPTLRHFLSHVQYLRLWASVELF